MLIFVLVTTGKIIGAQATKTEPPYLAKENEKVFFEAEIAIGNLQNCVEQHLIIWRDGLKTDPQEPEDKVTMPPPMVDKDGKLVFDWPDGLHARYQIGRAS